MDKSILLREASPNFNTLERVLLGKQPPEKVYIGDLFVNDEVLEPFCECVLETSWVPKDENRELYYKNIIDCYRALQFDFMPVSHWIDSWLNFPETEGIVYEKTGLISTAEGYERFPWDEIQPDFSAYPIILKYLPEGMKLVVETGSFQDLLDKIVGYENLFYMLYDNLSLLERIIDTWFTFKYEFYKTVIKYDEVGAVWHADDLGSKSASLLSPDFIRSHLFPWYRKYADLVHGYGKMFWFHCCGNIYTDNLIDNFINYAKIDAFHSFQDEILPVTEFKARYGKDVGCIGGVDVNVLAMADENKLREYIKDILNVCATDGRYVLGSGNSITPYIPLDNLLIMVEEALNFRI